MCLYLTKRGATYYFRRAIPDELQSALGGRTEFTFSLRTKDKDAAKRRRSVEALRTDRELEDARARLGLVSTPQATHAADVLTPFRSQDEQELHEEMRRDEAEREARYEAREPLRLRLEAAFRKSTAEIEPWEAAARDLLRDARAEWTAEQERQVARRVERAERKRGISPLPDHSASSEGPQRLAPPAPAALPLLDTFDAYAAAQGVKPGTTAEWRARMQDLIRFLGHDDAARITEDDVQRWRDQLLSETVRGGKKRDPRTVRSTYISALRATLNWALEERKLARNVAASITVRVPKKPKLRERDFTPEEAAQILRASLVPSPPLSTERALARRWIPWLCGYTGARVNEFSQLRREDVKQVDGIWVVTITLEAGTVKANIARTVPLHSHLIEQGFAAAIGGRPDGPLFYDPQQGRAAGSDSRHYKKVGERLAQWVRKEVGITDPNVQPNHGWRHTFKSLALAAGMPERIADYIQGHAPKTVGRTYGSIPLKVLAEAIESLPRFKI